MRVSGRAMVRGMDPVRREGRFVFATGSDHAGAALATVAEEEGLSVLLPYDVAETAGLDLSLPMTWITLRVHSALDGVGLTAAVSGALAEEGIACNVVAGHHHDHVLVPEARSDEAMAILKALAEAA